MRLSDYAWDTYSRHGEDGMIAHVVQQIGPTSNVCCELGAGTGLATNTTRLWRECGWRAVLVEEDQANWQELVQNVALYRVEASWATVIPENVDQFVFRDVAVLSIAIPAPWLLWGAIRARPSLVLTDHSIPQWRAQSIGYYLIGETAETRFFARQDAARPFRAYDIDELDGVGADGA